MKKTTFFWTAVVWTFGCLAAVLGQVQTTTSITGTVRDASGSVIPGVGIEIRNQDTGAVRETVTNDLGYYNVASLQPGTYTITASLAGFKTSIVTDREAQVAIPAQVNVTLEIGELEESVTVSASGDELVNKTTAELAASIDQELVENLPNQTRNFFDLLALAPNTSPQYLSSGMSFGQHSMRRVNAAGSFESSGVFAAGSSDTASNVSIDGANSQIALYNQSVNIISSSTIKELRLQTASANAEFGYGSNAVNVITKGGTNDFHGEVFIQHRNNNLDANDFFTNLAGNVLPEYKRNKFGASFGGPVLKDKLHFFGNYEGSRLRQAIQGTATVAPAEVRKGDFSNAVLPGAGGKVVKVSQVYNPFDFDPATGLRRPFPNNKIPANLLDPAIQKLLDFTALPNTVIDGVPRYSGLARTDIDENQFTNRVDYQTGDNTIWGRYTWAERNAFRGGLISILEGENTPASSHTAAINWTRLFGANMVNDLSVSYSRPKWGIGRPKDEVPDVATLMGLRNMSNLGGSPGIGAGDYSVGASGLFVWDPTQNTYQVKDDFSVTHSQHTFKTGLHVTERRLYFLNQSSDKGRLAFQPTFTRPCALGNATCEAARAEAGFTFSNPGLTFADLLLGTIDNVNMELRDAVWHGYQTYYGTYFQDTWQIHPRLTLNLGFRYEYWQPWTLPRNTAVGFDFNGDGRLIHALANPLDAFNPALEYGRQAPLNPNLPRSGYETSHNLAPRIGFAFTVTPNTVVRMAGGIFYAGNINTNQLSDIQGGAPPFTRTARHAIGRDEQVPPFLARNMYPEATNTAVPSAFENPPASARFPGDRNYGSPTVYQWSLSAQHRFSASWSVNLDYLGSHTIRNSQFVNLNAAELPVGPLAGKSLQERRRLPGWGILGSWIPVGWQKYHSGTIGIRNREWKGLSTMANFTWAKNLSSSRNVLSSDTGNRHYRFFDIWAGRANLTPTARFITAWSYRLPFGRGQLYALSGLGDAVLGGWTLSGITEFSTGAPNTVLTADNSGTGEGTQLPNRLAGCDLNDAPRDRFQWFNTSCFVEPAFGTWGTSSQGLLNEPGINNWNMTLAKSFALADEHELEFRWETYNTFNHTQWLGGNYSFTSGSFGRIGATRPARQMQFSLFYKF